jgi:hypothetical protein
MLVDKTILPTALVSVESARDYLRLEDIDQDPVLTQLINGVTIAIERACARPLRSRTITQVLSGHGSNYILLDIWPATALTSVKSRAIDDTLTDIDKTGWRVTQAGMLYLPIGYMPSGVANIEIAGEFGYKAATHDAELAALELAALVWLQVQWHTFTNQIGRQGSTTVGAGVLEFESDKMPASTAMIVEQFRRRDS